MPTIREQRKAETRAAITAAALRLFADHGYQAVTMADVAAAAGISDRTLFRYVADKEDLLFGEDVVLQQVLATALAERPGDEPPVVALTRAAPVLFALFEGRRDELRLRTAVIDATPTLAGRDRGKQAGFEALLADGLVARGVEPDGARLLARVTMACYDEAVRAWVAADAGPPLAERFSANLRRVGDLVA